MDVSNLSFIYIFIVDNLELEAKNSQSILMSESLLDCVVVDVPVDHVELKWVPGIIIVIFQHAKACFSSMKLAPNDTSH